MNTHPIPLETRDQHPNKYRIEGEHYILYTDGTWELKKFEVYEVCGANISDRRVEEMAMQAERNFQWTGPDEFKSVLRTVLIPNWQITVWEESCHE